MPLEKERGFVIMNKRKYAVLAGLSAFGLLLVACAGTNNESRNETGRVEEPEIQEIQDVQEMQDMQDVQETQDIQDISSDNPEENIGTEEIDEPETPAPAEQETASVYFVIENPSQEYYLTSPIASEEEIFVSLEKLSEEENAITDTEAWFAANGLTQPLSNSMEDGQYRYELVGDNGFYTYILTIYEKESGNFRCNLDFSEYRYTDNIKAGDEEFVEQRIWWAQSVDDVLYVAIGHYTYTESCPHTGYLVAINLNDMSVIWKSEPCVTNGRTFEIIDNTIVCGYGFTSEPDNLILVNRLDGTVEEKIPIHSMADYIIQKDDVLYVRTYNRNYTFQILREISCR